jgi:tetratricopeptide (TPR) repeat protein
VQQKIQTIVLSLLSFLCLTCLVFFFWLKPELIQVKELSELISDQGIVDQNQALQLQTTILFVRQSFDLAINMPAVWPLLISCILSVVGLITLVLYFKEITKISWVFLIAGLVLGIGIISLNSPNINYEQSIQLLAELINLLGILGILAITVLSSAAIPQLIFQLGHSQSYSQSLKNWLILGGFYLVNTLLSYGNTHLYWDLSISIPPLLFGIAAWILFIWNNKTNTLLRMGLGTLAITTLFTWVSLGNDAGIAASQHWILICQITMAFLFPLFLLSNFQSPIQQNLPVHKITHKAPRVPLNLIYIGTCILGLAWVFARNGSVWHQTKAAMANQSGDIAWLFQDKKQAEFDYHKAMGHSKLNGQSSFRLANLAIESNDLEAAAYYLSTSQLKHPTYASFVGLANIFQKENQIFQALFTLQKGNQLFPNNLQILTQLAHTYESLNLIDSAQYFYQKAALSNPDNSLAQANLLYATKRDVNIKPTEDAAIQANKLAISLKKGTSSSDTPYNTNFKPTGDLRDWAYLYNAMLFYKAKQPLMESGQWIKQGYANTIFPDLQLLDAWQDYYHNKPLRALEKLSLLVDSDATGKLDAYKNIMEFWHKSMRIPHGPVPIKDLNSALHAIEAYPFQADILQEAILILNANKNEKQAYEASLHAARWNEDDATFQWIYALQALKIGEIDYAKEAMNHVLSQDPKLFLARKPIFDRELQQAIGRQKF